MKFIPHSDSQDRALFSQKKILAYLTGIQVGKGLPYNELVLTPTGYRRVSSIKVGDTLYDRNGEPTTVTGVFPQGVRPCFRITFTDGADLVTDDNHLNVVKHRSGRPEHVRSTRYLYENSFLWAKSHRKVTSRPQIPAISAPIELPEQQFIISPYIMGALLGDGSTRSGSISLSSGDIAVIRRVRRELPKLMKIEKKNSGSLYDYKITHKIRATNKNGSSYNLFTSELRHLKLFGCGSLTKFIPDIYKFSSPEQRLALLQGLMDTDGSIKNLGEGNKSGRIIEFYSISKQLADDVIWLVESLGGKAWWALKKAPLYTHNGELRHGKDCYRVHIISPLVNPFYLPRKAKKYFKHENTPNKVIKDISPVKARETICFSVDSPTKTYIARGQVVTHNTTVGALRTKMRMHQYTDKNDNFLICAPTYKILQQSTLPAFLKFMEGYGEYSKSDAVFSMYGGGKAYMRTATEPDSIVGLTQVRHCWLDEAGKVTLYFFENLMARSAFMNCQVDLTSSPYTLNWLYKQIVLPKMRDPSCLPDVELIQAASWENPYMPAATIEHARRTMDKRRFNALFGGQWERMAGLVFDCFDEELNQVAPFEIPREAAFYGGIDWGFTEPFACVVHAIMPNGDRYQVEEVYKTGLTLVEIEQITRKLMAKWGVKIFYADPSQPASIEYLCRHGVVTVPANNDIRLGVDMVYEQFKARSFKLFKGANPFTIDELDTYHYPDPRDLKPDQDAKEAKPVDQNNHLMDSVRYCLVMTTQSHVKLHPKAPGLKRPQTEAEKIAALMKMPPRVR